MAQMYMQSLFCPYSHNCPIWIGIQTIKDYGQFSSDQYRNSYYATDWMNKEDKIIGKRTTSKSNKTGLNQVRAMILCAKFDNIPIQFCKHILTNTYYMYDVTKQIAYCQIELNPVFPLSCLTFTRLNTLTRRVRRFVREMCR